MQKVISKLSDKQLIADLHVLNRTETRTTAEILLHLIEVERRGLYRERGYDSMFSFCCGELKYSESEANRRIAAARLIGRFPKLFSHLCGQEVNLTTLSLVAGILNTDSYEDIVPKILGKSRRHVEGVVAVYRPKVSVKEYVKPVVIVKPAPALKQQDQLAKFLKKRFLLQF